MITEVFRAMGDWELTLKPETPTSVYNALGFFGHVIVTAAQWDTARFDENPASAIPMLSKSVYTGVLLRRRRADDDTVTVGGPGLAFWLGDGDEQGELITTTGPSGTDNFVNWVNHLIPASLSAGTITPVGSGTFTRSYVNDSRRLALDEVCERFGGEWRVKPNGTVDAGPRATVFGSTPKAIALPDVSASPDDSTTLVSINNPKVAVTESAENYLTGMFSLVGGPTQGTAAVVTAQFVHLNGAAVNLAGVIEVTAADATEANSIAAAELALTGLSRAVEITCDEVAFTNVVPVGADIYVYDPLRNLVNTANALTYSGRAVFPVRVRLKAAEWPVVAGMGVYYRSAKTPASVIDLTPYVSWETGRTRLSVDNLVAAPVVTTENRRTKRRKPADDDDDDD